MLLKTLPLPVAPHSSFLLRTQPLLHFRFLRFRSSPPILPQLRQRHFARFQQPARSREQLPAIPLRPLQMPRRWLPPPWPLLLRLPLLPAHQCFPPLRQPQPPRRPRRIDSPPDKSCPPSSRRCQEFPSTAPASSLP